MEGITVKTLRTFVYGFGFFILVSCGDANLDFSAIPETEVFYQSNGFSNKLDILWVMDNSGSMSNLQTNIANNFNAFIQSFAAKQYDYQVAVTTTEAWRANYGYSEKAKFRTCGSNGCSGVAVITPDTPNAMDAFQLNIIQGTGGSGDERGLESMEAALSHPSNVGFLRPDAFLAVIFITDEEDFSADTSTSLGNHSQDYSDPRIIPVQNYIDFLDNLTNYSVARRYNVSAVAIPPGDSSCLSNNRPDGKYANRYLDIIQATRGVMGTVCSSNFSKTLDEIQSNIAMLSTQFYLNKIPVVHTISVVVNGVAIPRNIENGWSYDEEFNSILFHGSALPNQGSQIVVNFEPKFL